jgi:hypothetical protein
VDKNGEVPMTFGVKGFFFSFYKQAIMCILDLKKNKQNFADWILYPTICDSSYFFLLKLISILPISHVLLL